MPRTESASPPDQLKFFFLGPFRIERGTRTLQLPTRKVEILLAYLVLHAGEHAREKLAALFWGDFPDAEARASLRNALATLHKHLGDDVLLADRDTAQINPMCPLWVDAWVAQSVANSPQPALTDLEAAIALCQGPLLADFYDEWLELPRQQYRTLYLTFLLQLARLWREQGESARALDFARRVLTIERANEQAHQQIMLCYAALGNRDAALRQYAECVRALADELGVQPLAETTALAERIKREDSARAVVTPHNLPTLLTRFVGRETELSQIRQLLATTRLLTLTGAGGCGKTRLGIQVASDLLAAGAFRDGVWFVDLAETTDAALVPHTVAQTLGMRELSDQPLVETIAAAISTRQILLLFDNCEHLIAACARLADSLLRACPNLSLLVTSRESFGIAGETIWRVPPLTFPDVEIAPTELLQFDAVRLFVDRATVALPSFRLTEQNASAVVQICRRLDGMPLAIELAAARVPMLTIEQIARRLDDRFRLLTGGSRIATPRQQTLRAMMDWSYALLSEPERAMFRQLSVFAGGWTLEAAESVTGDAHQVAREDDPVSRRSSVDTLDLLTALVDKSLVVVEQKGETTRYRMLETIRQYARDRLFESAEAAVTRARHRDWFLQLAEHAEPCLRGAGQIEWLTRLEAEQDNLRAALEWSFGSDAARAEDAPKGLRLASALWQFWAIRGYLPEGRGWLERALRECPPDSAPSVRGVAFGGASVLAYLQGDLVCAGDLGERCRARADETVDKVAVAAALLVLGEYQRHVRRDLAQAQLFIEESLNLAWQSNDKWLMAITLFNLGLQERAQANHARAVEVLQASADLCRELGDRWLCAAALDELGWQVYAYEEPARATALWESSLKLRRDLQDKGGIAGSLNNLAQVARFEGDYARAASIYETSLALFRELGQRESIPVVLHGLGCVAVNQGDYGRATQLFAESLSLFRELRNEQCVAQCLAGFASVAHAKLKSDLAARLLGAVQVVFDALSVTLVPADRVEWERVRAAVRAALGDDAFAAAMAAGRKIPVAKAIELALTI